MSVLAADRRYEEPRSVPRPGRRRQHKGPSRQGMNGTSSPSEVMAFFGGRIHSG